MSEQAVTSEPDKKEALVRLVELHRQRDAINQEIRLITFREGEIWPSVSCKRCGFSWKPKDPFIPPTCCARCGSKAWQKSPTTATKITRRPRHPGEPPAPSWRKRKGHRGKLIPSLEQKPPVAPEWSTQPPVKDPAIDYVIPPPPEPAPMRSLSEMLREVAVMRTGPDVMIDGELHRRDEVNIMNVETPIEEPSSENEEGAAETQEIAPPQADGDISEDKAQAVIGRPQTGAEREELEKARAEVWPTTRPED